MTCVDILQINKDPNLYSKSGCFQRAMNLLRLVGICFSGTALYGRVLFCENQRSLSRFPACVMGCSA